MSTTVTTDTIPAPLTTMKKAQLREYGESLGLTFASKATVAVMTAAIVDHIEEQEAVESPADEVSPTDLPPIPSTKADLEAAAAGSLHGMRRQRDALSSL